MISGVCLDLDGTLAHRHGDFSAFLDGIRTELGLLACDFDGFQDVLARELGRDGAMTFGVGLRATLATFGQRRDDDDLGPVVARALATYAGAMHLLPGAAALLDDLHDLPLALITNGPADMQRAAVAAVGIADRFRELIVSGDPRVAARKPAARPFALACEALGCRPDEVLMIGDNVRCDVGGALAFGMRAVRIGGPGGDGYEGFADLAALRGRLDPLLG